MAKDLRKLPTILKNHILPFDWDNSKVWNLEAQSITIERCKLDYLLELPFWSSLPKVGMTFDISPLEVINNPEATPHQFERLMNADLSYPIDMLSYENRTWILDGIHRLAKAYLLNKDVLELRIHEHEVITRITMLK